MAAWQGKGAASYAESLVNLVNPGTYDLTEWGTAPTWDATNGWDFAGAEPLKTGVYPTAARSYIVRFTNAGTIASDRVFGAYDTWPGNWGVGFWPRHSERILWGSGDYYSYVGWVASGRMALSGLRCFYNGDFKGVPPSVEGSWPGDFEIWIGSVNYDDGALGLLMFEGKVQAAACYDCNLTDAQVAAVDASMAAL